MSAAMSVRLQPPGDAAEGQWRKSLSRQTTTTTITSDISAPGRRRGPRATLRANAMQHRTVMTNPKTSTPVRVMCVMVRTGLGLCDRNAMTWGAMHGHRQERATRHDRPFDAVCQRRTDELPV